jgi:hypothetical protein
MAKSAGLTAVVVLGSLPVVRTARIQLNLYKNRQAAHWLLTGIFQDQLARGLHRQSRWRKLAGSNRIRDDWTGRATHHNKRWQDRRAHFLDDRRKAYRLDGVAIATSAAHATVWHDRASARGREKTTERIPNKYPISATVIAHRRRRCRAMPLAPIPCPTCRRSRCRCDIACKVRQSLW